jgi:hypothetical protein
VRTTALATLLAATLLGAGCSAIGYHRLAGPAAAEPAPEGAPRALLVIVDGLRADVLSDYLRTLREADHEPSWPSGLSLLVRGGARLAPARAEAPMPGFGLAADAALLTGQHPDATGIPGSVFFEASADGSLRRFDFTDAADAARIYFEPGFTLPDAEHRPLLETLLRAPTLYERLPPGQAVSVLHVFGRGAEWLVPQRSGDGINAILQHEISSWAVPLFDRAVRNAAIDVALGRTPPRLMTLYFRGVSAGSCYQAERACQVEPPDLQAVQTEQLRQVDGHLERILNVLAGSRPEGLSSTTVVLTGTGGLVERIRVGLPESAHQLTPTHVFDRLAGAVDGACSTWLRQAAGRGDLVLAPNGQLAHVYVRRLPPGQQADRAFGLECLGTALRKALHQPVPADASERGNPPDSLPFSAADAWLAAAAWQPGTPGASPRGVQAEVALSDSMSQSLAASRRGRILARLRRAFDDGAVTRSGDALLFVAAPWIFTDPRLRRPSVHAGSGGLEDAAVGTAFLIADPRLDDLVLQGLTTTAVELADVVPTLLAVLQAPPEASAGLARPPLITWQGDRLTFVAADRQVQPPPAFLDARLVWRETPEALTFGLEEPSSLWPPDRLALRFGDQRFDWQPEGAPFPADGPCRFQDVEGRRSWLCTVPVDRAKAGLSVAGIRRAPAGEPGEKPSEFTDVVVPVVLGPADGPRIERLDIACATPESVKLELVAEDALGLDRIELVVADRYGGGLPDRIRAGLQARTSLGGLLPAAVCRTDPLDPGCVISAPHPRWSGPVRVDFPLMLLEHERQASRLLSVNEGDAADLLQRFGTTPFQEPPRFSWLMARVCGVNGQCTERPLISDRDFAARVEAGCPPAAP